MKSMNRRSKKPRDHGLRAAPSAHPEVPTASQEDKP